ncbi:pyruvate, water dikinase [Rubritalea squalenifaciens DSM 18772]|uniref:Pyruvate, water dikinase n=1 Tax=Rubritalea squalenifaciens DSM 18772 TaxID=1123071 RepID=A0A1M6IYV2_9BACT|nr:PEP/pyruvate-binding domain-containing protein [Rubritalea squalenifaciens]SHJ39626.1 pyruvate, water dikinase [Rubritalea squalenifaciens DSM 18772]
MIITQQNAKAHLGRLGGKAASLAELAETDILIPDWFAVTTDYQPDFDAALPQAIGELDADFFAVRSSAACEDGKAHSFAGQFESYLYVPIEKVPQRIKDVQSSHQSEHLKSYQENQNSEKATAPTALVQIMLTPDVSGVAFSVDPVTGNRQRAVVSALWGTGSALVSGDADADQWKVDPDDIIIESKIAHKSILHIPSPSSSTGYTTIEVPSDQQDIPCLSEAQIRDVAELARKCAAHFGCPQDIEWAYSKGKLYLLQSRPITTLNLLPDPTDPLTIWDNSNIAESYSGITSPLTFSFAKRIYEHVYREFCGLLNVPKRKIRDNDDVFPQMLGHINGRVYYNLISWYRVLAMLPGFKINRSFMEQMMGVKEPMPEEIVERIASANKTNRLRDGVDLAGTMMGLGLRHFGLKRQINKFYKRLNSALDIDSKSLTSMSLSELSEHYRTLENQLLKHWDAPLVNDFFAMIYYGVLRKKCEKWLDDASLQNELLLDSGDIISAEPPRRITEMAQLAKKDKDVCRLLANPEHSAREKLKAMEKMPALHEMYEQYVKDFGDRCLEELKLESPTVEDSPNSLLNSIGMLAMNPSRHTPPVTRGPSKIEQLSWLKKVRFNWILKQTRNRVRDRENLRFERTRLFGRVRKIMVEIGKRLHADYLIDQPEDVFLLKLDDILGVTDGSTDAHSLRDIVEARRSSLEKAIAGPVPPDRFETRGPAHRYREFKTTLKEPDLSATDLEGTPACPGSVKGRVRVVTNPRNATLLPGEILVAQQTDPGWVVLFPPAAGLLVERGSLLSHSAIVARELNLPCIVSIPHVTKVLKTGDMVEMNGRTGAIRIIKMEETLKKEE